MSTTAKFYEFDGSCDYTQTLSWLGGSVRLRNFVENRYPQDKDGENKSKYKHFIWLYLFGKRVATFCVRHSYRIELSVD